MSITIVVVVCAVVRAVVRKGLWLNGFVYDIRESTDIVNTKLFNTTLLPTALCRHRVKQGKKRQRQKDQIVTANTD